MSLQKPRQQKQRQYLPLLLSAKRKAWRQNDERTTEANASFRKIEKSILERDAFSCRFCGFRDLHGFRSPRYLSVHHRDDDHDNNAAGNLLTACHPCHMCHHIGFAGMSGDYGLAWVPELPQAALCHLTRACFVAVQFTAALEQGQVPRQTRTEMQAITDAASHIVDDLIQRREQAYRLYHTDDLVELGNALLALPDHAYAARRQLIGGLRLLPLGTLSRGGTDVMPKIIERWLAPKGPFAGFKPTNWLSLFTELERHLHNKEAT
jgi:hypothetical protein